MITATAKMRTTGITPDKAMVNPRSLLTLRLDKVIKEAINKVIKVGKDLLDLNTVFVERFLSCDPAWNLWKFFWVRFLYLFF
jgi:hypothetical protein